MIDKDQETKNKAKKKRKKCFEDVFIVYNVCTYMFIEVTARRGFLLSSFERYRFAGNIFKGTI